MKGGIISMPKIIKDGVEYTGTGIKEVTQEQYDRLTASEKNKDVLYQITDAVPSSDIKYASTVTLDPVDGISATNVQDAIAEMATITLSTILTRGNTTVTFTNSRINSNTMFEFFTSVFDVNPVEVSVRNGSITLTFDAQSVDMTVAIRFK